MPFHWYPVLSRCVRTLRVPKWPNAWASSTRDKACSSERGCLFGPEEMAEELAAEVEVYGVSGAIVVRVSAQDTFLRPATTAGAKMVCATATVRACSIGSVASVDCRRGGVETAPTGSVRASGAGGMPQVGAYTRDSASARVFSLPATWKTSNAYSSRMPCQPLTMRLCDA